MYIALSKAANDSILKETYQELHWYYQEVNRDSVLFYSERALPIAKQLKLKLHEADILDGKAYVLMVLGSAKLFASW